MPTHPEPDHHEPLTGPPPLRLDQCWPPWPGDWVSVLACSPVWEVESVRPGGSRGRGLVARCRRLDRPADVRDLPLSWLRVRHPSPAVPAVLRERAPGQSAT